MTDQRVGIDLTVEIEVVEIETEIKIQEIKEEIQVLGIPKTCFVIFVR